MVQPILKLIGTDFPNNLVSSNGMQIEMPIRTYRNWCSRSLDSDRSLANTCNLLCIVLHPMNCHTVDIQRHPLPYTNWLRTVNLIENEKKKAMKQMHLISVSMQDRILIGSRLAVLTFIFIE